MEQDIMPLVIKELGIDDGDIGQVNATLELLIEILENKITIEGIWGAWKKELTIWNGSVRLELFKNQERDLDMTEFEIKSGKVMVSDPCYEKGLYCLSKT